MLPSFIHAVGSLVVIRSSCCPYLVFVPDQSSTCPPLPDSQQQFKLVQWLHFEKFPSNRSSAYFIHRRISREPSVGCPIRSPRFIRAYVRRFFFFSFFVFCLFSGLARTTGGAKAHAQSKISTIWEVIRTTTALVVNYQSPSLPFSFPANLAVLWTWHWQP